MSESAYHPVLFRVREEAMAADPAAQVHDRIEAQLRDLMATRHPGAKLSPAELTALVRRQLDGRTVDEYGVWVYYPWSRRLVHLLDEAEFVELRTNRNCYKITPEEQKTLRRKRAGIVGLSVGQSVALTLALERSFGELRLADFDHIDLSNLNRIRTGVHNLGVAKVIVTAREIAEIDPFLEVRCFAGGLSGEDYDAFLLEGGKLDLLIEECDSIDVKVRVRHEAKRHRIPVLMDTSDRGMLDIERFDLQPDRPILHGLVGDLDPAGLSGLTTDQKVPYVLKILGVDSLSTTLRASMIEVESSISTWPQLASGVALGGALTADVARRVLLGTCRVSGRFHVDLGELVPDEPVSRPEQFAPAPRRLRRTSIAAQARKADAPAADVPTKHIRKIVSDGILAPSGGNCQPWLWYWDGRLHLFHDQSRSHSLLDFESSAAYVALGAAWENVEVSARQLGWQVQAHLHETGDLAITFSLVKQRKREISSMYDLIGLRHTNRRLQGRKPLPTGCIEAMTAAAESAGGFIHWVTSPQQLEEMGELLGAGDRLRFLHRELHRQLMSELRFTREEAVSTGDGIAIETLEIGAGDRAGIEIARSWEALSLVRSWSGGANLTKLSRKAIRSSSAVGILWMPGTARRDFLEGGRAVERVWFAATRQGIAFHPMTALPYLFARLTRGCGAGLDDYLKNELSRLLPRYRGLVPVPDSAAQVMLFRVAVADAASERALRRPVDDCFYLAPARSGSKKKGA